MLEKRSYLKSVISHHFIGMTNMLISTSFCREMSPLAASAQVGAEVFQDRNDMHLIGYFSVCAQDER